MVVKMSQKYLTKYSEGAILHASEAKDGKAESSTTMEELTIDTTATDKRTVKLCRSNADGTLTPIGTAKVLVTTDFSADTQTAKYKGKVYAVKGTIYVSYIVVA